jgi:hypothetical protein
MKNLYSITFRHHSTFTLASSYLWIFDDNIIYYNQIIIIKIGIVLIIKIEIIRVANNKKEIEAQKNDIIFIT